MKTSTRTIKSLILASLMSIGFAKADHLADRLTFSARLTPASGVTTNANGVAAFMLNSTRDTLYFTTTVTSLSSALNGFHIHNARTGGNVVVDFDGKVQGTTVRSFFTGSQLNTLLPDFIAGNLYVAAHTVNNPAVEIFGTIKLESDWGFYAMLDGAQGGNASPAKGHASINFGMKGDTAIVRIATVGLTGGVINGAHLHFGKAGQSGTVALSLESIIAPDGMSLVGGVNMLPTEWTTLMAALMMDSIYLNLHNTTFPGGEIRGQVRTTKDLRFDTWLNQGNITATGLTVNMASTAYGVATLSLNPTMDTLRFDGLFSGLTSSLNAAHFHNAAPTANGPVVKDIDMAITGNSISGVWTKYDAMEPLTANFINELLEGNIYMVIHTDSNPATGEVRGNVTRLAREGFIAEINATQAGTTSMGLGTAIATYNRDRTNLHYMIAFDGLTGTFTGAHFHTGKAGQSGPVYYDLDMPTNNGYYNYWTSVTGFNNANSLPFRNDSVYVNIHSSTNPNGEIRGQFARYYRISSETISTGVAEQLLNNGSVISMYPNPVNDILSVNLDAKASAKATLVLYDLNGRIVVSENAIITTGMNTISINTSTLNSGFYIAEIQVNGQAVSHAKLLKN
jgi:hypothetical protein